ncbi:hypothetical protein SEA_NORZ_11 [Mycobacterium phage Norz]|nr:hypothetical protein SEA_NORZ_11 [Mycobacterium phage Norz]
MAKKKDLESRIAALEEEIRKLKATRLPAPPPVTPWGPTKAWWGVIPPASYRDFTISTSSPAPYVVCNG